MVKTSLFLDSSFGALALILLAGFLAALYATSRRNPALGKPALRAAAIYLIWAAVTGGAAAQGALSFQGVPPTMFAVLAGTMILVVLFARSALARGVATTVPLWLLVGWQAFRLPLELLMHRAYTEGAMPVQMSFSGRNFDILTGLSALIVSILVWRGIAGRRTVLAWNFVGSLLLVNVVSIALTLQPQWVTQFPFVWLPVVMVASAVAGHVLVFRAVFYAPAARPSQVRASSFRAESKT